MLPLVSDTPREIEGKENLIGEVNNPVSRSTRIPICEVPWSPSQVSVVDVSRQTQS